MGFWEKLAASIEKRDSLLCVGLDPHPGQIPERYASVSAFMRAIVSETSDYACVFKPNIAFYEALGPDGMDVLAEILAAIPADIPVILDGKRNDITSTATAYAQGIFEHLGVDALTVNPYLGSDGVAPFLAYADRGVFLLCKTSNPGAGEIQDWTQRGVPLYQHVADLASTWVQGGEIGLVIGATYPEAVAEIRAAYPNTWFLVPGIGAQGGDLEAVLSSGLRADGKGVIINSSRGLSMQMIRGVQPERPATRSISLVAPPGASPRKGRCVPAACGDWQRLSTIRVACNWATLCCIRERTRPSMWT